MAALSGRLTSGMRSLLSACVLTAWLIPALPLHAQEIPDELGTGFRASSPSCFGVTSITEPRALEICDALFLRRNVQARELAETWVAEQPDSPAAHFSLAEVLSRVEGNLPRSLHHLHRAEDLLDYASMGRAMAAGNLEWHYLTLNELSYAHQLIGNQELALDYLERIEAFYGQDTESLRGWPLIKMERFEDARASAERVLQSTDDPRERSRAWNTLCAVELADLRPLQSMEACENSMSEEEGVSLLEDSTSADTVHLLNAAEVSLSLLRFREAEQLLDRSIMFPNPDSVGNPWIYLLYLYMNQGRFEEASDALDRMLRWRENQRPLVTIMNRAEHLMVSSMFLLLTGYADDAERLTRSALNQPDRTGSYSADEQQKDAIAALIRYLANRQELVRKQEEIATLGWLESLPVRFEALRLRFTTWRASRQAASLFADDKTLKNRLRPYAPLDVHIPEWVEPELVSLMGRGTMSALLEETRSAGAFALNEGYYHAYRTEIAWHSDQLDTVISAGRQAVGQLPAEEALLRARVSARIANAAWRSGHQELALDHYESALQADPSVVRRLDDALPVRITGENMDPELLRLLQRSPRFRTADAGLRITLDTGGGPALCLRSRSGDSLGCVDGTPDGNADRPIADLVKRFHDASFGPGLTLSRSQRLALLGGSIIGTSNDGSQQQNIDSLLLE
jgi:tetratricopeptide (TPR) repeat protein